MRRVLVLVLAAMAVMGCGGGSDGCFGRACGSTLVAAGTADAHYVLDVPACAPGELGRTCVLPEGSKAIVSCSWSDHSSAPVDDFECATLP